MATTKYGIPVELVPRHPGDKIGSYKDIDNTPRLTQIVETQDEGFVDVTQTATYSETRTISADLVALSNETGDEIGVYVVVRATSGMGIGRLEISSGFLSTTANHVLNSTGSIAKVRLALPSGTSSYLVSYGIVSGTQSIQIQSIHFAEYLISPQIEQRVENELNSAPHIVLSQDNKEHFFQRDEGSYRAYQETRYTTNPIARFREFSNVEHGNFLNTAPNDDAVHPAPTTVNQYYYNTTERIFRRWTGSAFRDSTPPAGFTWRGQWDSRDIAVHQVMALGEMVAFPNAFGVIQVWTVSDYQAGVTPDFVLDRRKLFDTKDVGTQAFESIFHVAAITGETASEKTVNKILIDLTTGIPYFTRPSLTSSLVIDTTQWTNNLVVGPTGEAFRGVFADKATATTAATAPGTNFVTNDLVWLWRDSFGPGIFSWDGAEFVRAYRPWTSNEFVASLGNFTQAAQADRLAAFTQAAHEVGDVGAFGTSATDAQIFRVSTYTPAVYSYAFVPVEGEIEVKSGNREPTANDTASTRSTFWIEQGDNSGANWSFHFSANGSTSFVELQLGGGGGDSITISDYERSGALTLATSVPYAATEHTIAAGNSVRTEYTRPAVVTGSAADTIDFVVLRMGDEERTSVRVQDLLALESRGTFVASEAIPIFSDTTYRLYAWIGSDNTVLFRAEGTGSRTWEIALQRFTLTSADPGVDDAVRGFLSDFELSGAFSLATRDIYPTVDVPVPADGVFNLNVNRPSATSGALYEYVRVTMTSGGTTVTQDIVLANLLALESTSSFDNTKTIALNVGVGHSLFLWVFTNGTMRLRGTGTARDYQFGIQLRTITAADVGVGPAIHSLLNKNEILTDFERSGAFRPVSTMLIRDFTRTLARDSSSTISGSNAVPNSDDGALDDFLRVRVQTSGDTSSLTTTDIETRLVLGWRRLGTFDETSALHLANSMEVFNANNVTIRVYVDTSRRFRAYRGGSNADTQSHIYWIDRYQMFEARDRVNEAVLSIVGNRPAVGAEVYWWVHFTQNSSTKTLTDSDVTTFRLDSQAEDRIIDTHIDDESHLIILTPTANAPTIVDLSLDQSVALSGANAVFTTQATTRTIADVSYTAYTLENDVGEGVQVAVRVDF